MINPSASILWSGLLLLTTTVAADELTNLAHERGVCYAFVDGDGEVLDPQEVGDGNQELTDRMSRTGGATAQRALRVRFDFTTSITPRAVIIDRQWKANELGVGLDRVRILVGNSPDSLAEVLTEEAIGADYARENKAVRLDLPKTDGRYVQVEIEAAGKFTIREIEVLGPKEDSRAIAAAPSTMLSNSGLDPVGNLDQLAAIGAIVLSHDLSEAQVRKMLAGAKANSVFVIPTGASWLLTDTLVIPDEVTVIGFHGGRSGTFTFKKGFDGPLAHVGSWVTLHGISFDGNRDEGFQGDGLVDPAGKGIREQKFVRVEVRNCAGHGFVFAVPHYYSIYQFCTFDRNGGYGAVYGQVRSHHTDNVWDSCHFGWNGQGGIAFHGVEASSVWENCEFFHNGGAAFDHFLIHKKSGPGKPIAPQPQVGAGALVIRNSVIRNHAGPVWLNRDGTSEAIVFEDCRLKHNGDPDDCSITHGSGKSSVELFGLTGPVGGLFHVERGQLFVELRGGFAWDNTPYLFTASTRSTPGSRLTISGAARSGHITGGVYAPSALLTVLDASLLQQDAHIHVASGIGLDPRQGKIVTYGPSDGPR